MKVQSKRSYSMEFKFHAVQSSIDSARTVNSTAKALGISPTLLSRWRVEMTQKSPSTEDQPLSNTGPERSYKDLERENQRLKKQLQRAELEVDILKKAKEYFDKKLK